VTAIVVVMTVVCTVKAIFQHPQTDQIRCWMMVTGLTELRLYVPHDTKFVFSETFFPASILAYY